MRSSFHYRPIFFLMRRFPALFPAIVRCFFKNARLLSLASRKSLVRRAGLAALNGGPFLAQLNVTNACNQRCGMCNLWHDGQTMPFSDVKKTIDVIAEMGACLLTITGGEPVLHPHLREIIKYASGKEFVLNINTNGSLPLKYYSGLPLHLLDIATISFHSLRSDVLEKITGRGGLLKNVLNTVDYFRNNTHAHIVLKFVMSRMNIDEIDDVMSFADDRGISVEFDPVMVGSLNRPVATDDENLKASSEKLALAMERIRDAKMRRGRTLVPFDYYDFCAKALDTGSLKWNCHAGLAYFSVFPDGRFGICKDIYTGRKITDEGFLDIWRSVSFRDEMLTRRQNCEGCNWSCYHAVESFTNRGLIILRSL